MLFETTDDNYCRIQDQDSAMEGGAPQPVVETAEREES